MFLTSPYQLHPSSPSLPPSHPRPVGRSDSGSRQSAALNKCIRGRRGREGREREQGRTSEHVVCWRTCTSVHGGESVHTHAEAVELVGLKLERESIYFIFLPVLSLLSAQTRRSCTLPASLADTLACARARTHTHMQSCSRVYQSALAVLSFVVSAFGWSQRQHGVRLHRRGGRARARVRVHLCVLRVGGGV